ncbi:MAG: PTS transporter subunit EIIC [Bacillota bacterium]|nr:PTS transporter subunit EIIC [Bacillota bacterium]
MNFFDKLQTVMEKVISPIAKKMNENKVIKALASGMIATMPVSLGVAAICVLVTLPIPGWTDIVNSAGFAYIGNEIMSVTLSALAIYLVINVAYNYAQAEGENGMTAATISLGIFLMMMPVFIEGKGYFLQAIETKYIGSDGIFVGMLISALSSMVYCKLCKKNLKLKLPESVPPMVTNSLSPIFIAIIMFTSMAVVKYLFYISPYNNIFNFFNSIIAAPILKFGATPAAIIAVYTFASLMWFFGVHPSPIISTYGVVLTTAMTANIEAFNAGNVLPYLSYYIIYLCLFFSGTGNTLGLTLCFSKAKSERYKSMKAISLVPNLFNINEPVIFGTPVILNPIFLIPMILNTLLPGLLGWAVTSFVTISINPTIEMPWVTPTFITAFIQGGIPLFLLILGCIVLTTIVWYPFFKIADDEALKEEMEGAVNE